jgi:hypothetical protein
MAFRVPSAGAIEKAHIGRAAGERDFDNVAGLSVTKVCVKEVALWQQCPAPLTCWSFIHMGARLGGLVTRQRPCGARLGRRGLPAAT